ncbi:hypothetical protein [Variovorax ginsengisoli]|uniref:Uncharacterized protein n=1 Tax=Variovorax ginsengisoli TaxID=363844 RepID=A0ABT8SDI9_9BURK|nr:hypothetical protein [Variovorax ginsengisoli]MDN8617825.1 hypothetical protein [Variovorax ginsengisoli]MDO1536995.1 hypothetical protein [Variovorax ginsengisoli]
MSAALTFEVLRALKPFTEQHVAENAICHAGLTTMEECSRCGQILRARAVHQKVTAQLAIADQVTYAVAMRRNDLHACTAIERRWDLFGENPETVSVGLAAAAAGRDHLAAVAAHLNPEVTS